MCSAANPHNCAICQDNLETEDIVARYAILQAARPTRIRRYISADRTVLQARRIRWIKKASIPCFTLQITGNDPRFDHSNAVGNGDFLYPVHSDQCQCYASVFRNTTSDIAVTGAARSHGNFSFVSETKQSGNLFG